MLLLEIPLTPEGWNEEKQEFIEPKVQVLKLEHSLVSLSKWESKWHKPFLSKMEMTAEETLDYIKCMTITPHVESDIYNHLTAENIKDVQEYIANPMTATTFSEDKNGKASREVVTAELIYYWMIALNIPAEYQKWHLNKLLTLIRVCNIKNAPPKTMSKRETASRYAQLNAARRKRLNSKG